MSGSRPFLNIILGAILIWLASAIGGPLLWSLLILFRESGDVYNSHLAASASIWWFVFSLMLGFIPLLTTIPASILSLAIARKFWQTRKESSRRFLLHSVHALLAPLFVMCVPIYTRYLIEDALQLSLVTALVILIAFTCFMLLKQTPGTLFCFFLLNILLLFTFFMLASPDENKNYEYWESSFLFSMYYTPGVLVLALLTGKFKLLDV